MKRVFKTPLNLTIRKVLLLIIVLLAFFLRFYRLSEYPVHLGHDEVSQLYDAISIAETGKDIYGNRYPFIFRSVNDYKPPFYTYATALVYKIFGWQEVTIRITGAFFGTLMVIAVYFFVKEFFNDELLAIIASFLTAISPFEVFYSRKSFENQTGIVFMLFGFILLKRKRIFWGSMILGIASYIYFAQAVLIPILLVLFLLIFYKGATRIIIKTLLIYTLVVSPLIYLTITYPEVRNRSSAVFITQDPRLKGKSFGLVTTVVKKFIYQFNPKSLFFDGLDLTDGKRDVGPIFVISLPFTILGIWLLLKKKKGRKETLFIWVWILVSMIPGALTFEDYSPHRVIGAFTMINIIGAAGISWFFKRFGKVALIAILILYIANLFFFLKRYTVNYPIERSEALHYPLKEVALFAWENYDKYREIVFDPKFGEFSPWIGTASQYYFGFYGKYPPDKMQKEFKVGDQARRETKFDKFTIRAVCWSKNVCHPEDRNLKNTLIIASPWSLPPDIKKDANIVKTFYFKTTAVAFWAIKL